MPKIALRVLPYDLAGSPFDEDCRVPEVRVVIHPRKLGNVGGPLRPSRLGDCSREGRAGRQRAMVFREDGEDDGADDTDIKLDCVLLKLLKEIVCWIRQILVYQ